jgi:hypothetical protein
MTGGTWCVAVQLAALGRHVLTVCQSPDMPKNTAEVVSSWKAVHRTGCAPFIKCASEQNAGLLTVHRTKEER